MAGLMCSPHCWDRAIHYNKRQQQEPQEKGDTTRQPYHLFVSQERTVTETFSMGEEELGCSEKKGKPELIHGS
jgi:hypothetical protein